MRVAILANEQTGFIATMADGLKKMLDALGVEGEIFPNGLALLDYSPTNQILRRCKHLFKAIAQRLTNGDHERQQVVSRSEMQKFEAHVQGFDVIIVVSPIPNAFVAKRLQGIERIRKKTNVPIVLYQNYYLATRGEWSRKIMDSRNYGGGYGLERYDWYLAASVISEQALSRERHPYSQINKLYREYSALFLSFRESFGLPVVENQLCGNTIFLPHDHWAPSHYINKSLHQHGIGELGNNFMVYDHQLDNLKQLIIECKENHNPIKITDDFKENYPALHHGDLTELKMFIEKVSSGEIHGKSHRQYAVLNDGICYSKY